MKSDAEQKRDLAMAVRRMAPGLSLSSDREALLGYAEELDSEADALEATAEVGRAACC